MADQVNPLGGLVPGMTQTIPAVPVAPRPSPIQSPPPTQASPGGQDSVRVEEKQASGNGLDAAAKTVAAFIQQSPSDLKFMVDKATGQYYFKLVDPVTHQTIRQIPSEEVLAMARRLQQLSDPKGARGVLVDAEG